MVVDKTRYYCCNQEAQQVNACTSASAGQLLVSGERQQNELSAKAWTELRGLQCVVASGRAGGVTSRSRPDSYRVSVTVIIDGRQRLVPHR